MLLFFLLLVIFGDEEDVSSPGVGKDTAINVGNLKRKMTEAPRRKKQILFGSVGEEERSSLPSSGSPSPSLRR